MALMLDISVIPKARHQRVSLNSAGKLRIYLTAVPEKGRANDELIELLASSLGLPKRAVTIVLGATSRKKRVSIDADVAVEDVYDALGVERQLKVGA